MASSVSNSGSIRASSSSNPSSSSNSESSNENPASDSDDFKPDNKRKIQVALKSAPQTKKQHVCNECEYVTSRPQDLKRHHKTHSERKKRVRQLYKCDACPYQTTIPKKWSRHLETPKHQGTSEPTLLCPIKKCTFYGRRMPDLDAHVEEVHKIKIETEDKDFNNEEEFTKWKDELQIKHFQVYVKNKAGSRKTQTYVCHRKGVNITKSTGKRHEKINKSNKCGFNCPSRIKKTLNGDRIKVVWTKTHLGHQIESGRTPYTLTQKHGFADQLKLGIAPHLVLEGAYDQPDVLETQVLNLNAKDLANLKKKFGINKHIMLNDSDPVSIDMKCRQLKRNGDNGIFLYKQYNEDNPNYPNIKKKDFAMAYMNNGMEHMLKTDGQKVICIDGTHGTNSYGYELTTIMTLDDQMQGFPCAFFFHSCKNQATYTDFFKALKERVGEINTKVFMSDNEPAFYNAWCEVMQPPTRKLLCAWHVLRAWNVKLRCLKDGPLRTKVFRQMQALMQENKRHQFDLAYTSFLNMIKQDARTSDLLYDYFYHYLMIKDQWAYCYRGNPGVNTNMKLEHMHRDLKHKFMNGKKTKRLDVGFHAVLRYLKTMQFKRMEAHNRGKVTCMISHLRRAHKATNTAIENGKTQKNSVRKVNDGEWKVPSFTDVCEEYSVSVGDPTCCCVTRCDYCNACIHNYSCSCNENQARGRMCKHIHLVCMHLNQSEGLQPSSMSDDEDEDPDLVIDTNDFAEHRQEEMAAHKLDLSNSSRITSTTATKEAVTSLLLEALAVANNEDELQLLYESIQKAVETIDSRRNCIVSFPIPEGAKKQPANTNADKQPRSFYPKAKKQPQKKIHRPSHADIMQELLPVRMEAAESVDRFANVSPTNNIEASTNDNDLHGVQNNDPGGVYKKRPLVQPQENSEQETHGLEPKEDSIEIRRIEYATQYYEERLEVNCPTNQVDNYQQVVEEDVFWVDADHLYVFQDPPQNCEEVDWMQ